MSSNYSQISLTMYDMAGVNPFDYLVFKKDGVEQLKGQVQSIMQSGQGTNAAGSMTDRYDIQFQPEFFGSIGTLDASMGNFGDMSSWTVEVYNADPLSSPPPAPSATRDAEDVMDGSFYAQQMQGSGSGGTQNHSSMPGGSSGSSIETATQAAIDAANAGASHTFSGDKFVSVIARPDAANVGVKRGRHPEDMKLEKGDRLEIGPLKLDSAYLEVSSVIQGQISDLSNHTSTSLLEGDNKYFTTQRARDSISQTSEAPFANTSADLGSIIYDPSTGVITTRPLNEKYIWDRFSAGDAAIATAIGNTSQLATFAYDNTTGGMAHKAHTLADVMGSMSVKQQGAGNDDNFGLNWDVDARQMYLDQDLSNDGEVQFKSLVLSGGGLTVGAQGSAQDAVIWGNLTVKGTTITANTETILIEDNIMSLNHGENGAPAVSPAISGMRVELANDAPSPFKDAAFIYEAGPLGSALSGKWKAVQINDDSDTLGLLMDLEVKDLDADEVRADLVGDVTGDVTGRITNISQKPDGSAHDTSELSEDPSIDLATDAAPAAYFNRDRVNATAVVEKDAQDRPLALREAVEASTKVKTLSLELKDVANGADGEIQLHKDENGLYGKIDVSDDSANDGSTHGGLVYSVDANGISKFVMETPKRDDIQDHFDVELEKDQASFSRGTGSDGQPEVFFGAIRTDIGADNKKSTILDQVTRSEVRGSIDNAAVGSDSDQGPLANYDKDAGLLEWRDGSSKYYTSKIDLSGSHGALALDDGKLQLSLDADRIHKVLADPRQGEAFLMDLEEGTNASEQAEQGFTLARSVKLKDVWAGFEKLADVIDLSTGETSGTALVGFTYDDANGTFKVNGPSELKVKRLISALVTESDKVDSASQAADELAKVAEISITDGVISSSAYSELKVKQLISHTASARIGAGATDSSDLMGSVSITDGVISSSFASEKKIKSLFSVEFVDAQGQVITADENSDSLISYADGVFTVNKLTEAEIFKYLSEDNASFVGTVAGTDSVATIVYSDADGKFTVTSHSVAQIEDFIHGRLTATGDSALSYVGAGEYQLLITEANPAASLELLSDAGTSLADAAAEGRQRMASVSWNGSQVSVESVSLLQLRQKIFQPLSNDVIGYDPNTGTWSASISADAGADITPATSDVDGTQRIQDGSQKLATIALDSQDASAVKLSVMDLDDMVAAVRELAAITIPANNVGASIDLAGVISFDDAARRGEMHADFLVNESLGLENKTGNQLDAGYLMSREGKLLGPDQEGWICAGVSKDDGVASDAALPCAMPVPGALFELHVDSNSAAILAGDMVYLAEGGKVSKDAPDFVTGTANGKAAVVVGVAKEDAAAGRVKVVWTLQFLYNCTSN